jgi:hypothetical protein
MGRPMLWRTRHSFLASEAHSLTRSKLVRDADCRQRARQRVRLGGGCHWAPLGAAPLEGFRAEGDRGLSDCGRDAELWQLGITVGLGLTPVDRAWESSPVAKLRSRLTNVR